MFYELILMFIFGASLLAYSVWAFKKYVEIARRVPERVLIVDLALVLFHGEWTLPIAMIGLLFYMGVVLAGMSLFVLGYIGFLEVFVAESAI